VSEEREEEPKAPATNITDSLLSPASWVKYGAFIMIPFCIVLWKAATMELDQEKKKNTELQSQLNKCNEARTLDAQRREEKANERAERIDKFIDESMDASRQKYFQPKIDSLKNL
jgi:hypothetical protein